ncbi:MAG: M67 family metallopeptidase [Synergistaceae bacterium]|jgi:proteasome lid subunit RPN8/RPN11|nr:M67 family metallopeptidase [Synergistaceae bacterium]
MIVLPDSASAAIMSEGERAYPNECCGALLGSMDDSGGRVVSEILPIHNGRETEEQYHRFVIGPDDFMASEKTARARGLDVIGFYHSHPDHPAVPSDYDREHALPWYSYVIVAVKSGVSGDLTSWELDGDRSRFIKEL